MVKITKDNELDFKNGWLCPKCGSHTNTFRHLYAKRWCPSCDYVLKEEGYPLPYSYLDHLDKEPV